MPDATLKTISAIRLRKLLRYNRRTGLFHWRNKHWSMCAGDRAGCLNKDGYWRITVDGRTYPAHQLAWLYVTGRFPKRDLDHRNRRRADNRFRNLRLASPLLNQWNKTVSKRSRTGLKGASWDDGDVRKKKWRARIVVRGKNIDLGRYETPKEAHQAYAASAREHFGEFSHA